MEEEPRPLRAGGRALLVVVNVSVDVWVDESRLRFNPRDVSAAKTAPQREASRPKKCWSAAQETCCNVESTEGRFFQLDHHQR